MNLTPSTAASAKPRRSLLRLVGKAIGIILILAILGIGTLAAVIQFGSAPVYSLISDEQLKIEVTPERVAHGREIATMRCIDCHHDPKTERLSGTLITDIPKALTPAAHTANITQHPTAGIGGFSDGQLVTLLRTGVRPDGRLLAPWMPRMVHASDEDVYSVIAFLRSGDKLVLPDSTPSQPSPYTFLAKALSRFAWRPEPLPARPIVAPPIADQVAYGKYVVQGLVDCYSCHSADFATVVNTPPEASPGYLGGGNAMADQAGNPVFSANLTMDKETGLGQWTEAQFIRAVRDRMRPDGTALRYPMPNFKDLSEEQVAAIFAYLKSVPPISNRVERTLPK